MGDEPYAYITEAIFKSSDETVKTIVLELANTLIWQAKRIQELESVVGRRKKDDRIREGQQKILNVTISHGIKRLRCPEMEEVK